MEDVSALKVADLKRELKERGLPSSGTKPELVQRLQEALSAEKPTSDDSALDDVLLDEDSMLAGEDDDSSGAEVDETSDNETSLNEGVDSTTLLGQTSPTKAGVVPPAGQLSPAKKRNGTADSEDGESAAKKLKINRDPVQPPPVKKAVVPPPSPTKATTVPAAAVESSDSEAGKVNIKAVSATLSLAERSKLRQQKFSLTDDKPEAPAAAAAVVAAGGASGSAVSGDKLQQRAARFGISAPTTASAPTKAAAAKGKAAAVAKVEAAMTPEEQAALAKRRERFGKELAETKQNADAAKEKRAARFGNAVIGTTADTDDKKKTRAARFGV